MRTPLRPLSRRGLLSGTLGSAALLALGGGLAGCGTRARQQTEAGCVSEDLSATERKLVFSNWPQYIDVDEKDEPSGPTLDAFTGQDRHRGHLHRGHQRQQRVLRQGPHQLAACQPTDRDIMVLTDWMAARIIRLGWSQKLDPAKLPERRANLLPSLRDRSLRPEHGVRHAVAVRPRRIGVQRQRRPRRSRTVDELLTRPDLKGRVTVLTEMRDTMGLLLQSNGNDPANFTDAEFDAALAKLQEGRRLRQIRRFTGNDYVRTWPRATSPPASRWSGDVIQLGFEDDEDQVRRAGRRG